MWTLIQLFELNYLTLSNLNQTRLFQGKGEIKAVTQGMKQ